MDVLVLILVAAGVIAVSVMIVLRITKRSERLRRSLRSEYARQMNLPPAQAYEAMEERVEVLMRQKPGHTLEWYLQYVLDELKRDRR